jgi:hypothetical protein
MKTDPVYEILCSLVHRAMDKPKNWCCTVTTWRCATSHNTIKFSIGILLIRFISHILKLNIEYRACPNTFSGLVISFNEMRTEEHKTYNFLIALFVPSQPQVTQRYFILYKLLTIIIVGAVAFFGSEEERVTTCMKRSLGRSSWCYWSAVDYDDRVTLNMQESPGQSSIFFQNVGKHFHTTRHPLPEDSDLNPSIYVLPL